MKTNTTNQGGFIKMVVILVILIAILSYFGFNIKEFIDSDIVKENFGFIWKWISIGWSRYLAGPVEYLWNDIFINLIWYPFVEALQSIKGGSLPTLGGV